jgi:hypothetical protein
MVEYKKKKLILQSGGTRNYYYKVSSNGKKKQVSKNEYLEQKGGMEGNENSNKNRILSELDEVINNMKQGDQSRTNYERLKILVLDIVNKKIEIPTKYQWKSSFDEVVKKHFKNNGTTKVSEPYPWRAANNWEGSLATLFARYVL